MRHSVESRFLAIVCAALLLFVAPLFVLFLVLSSERAVKDQRDHVSILLTVNQQALGKPLWELDQESVSQIIATILADPTVMAVSVRDISGSLNITRPTFSTFASPHTESISREITYETPTGRKNVGTVTVYFEEFGVFSSLKQIEVGFISIFIFAVIAVFGAAIIGNRLIVITPLLRLSDAIQATRRLGSRHHVDWQSNDEMGMLAASFNEMQSTLEREERELKLAHKRATDIYNLTPAMLFSLDPEDRITAVSNYWLVATGYERHDIIGQRFEDKVHPGSRGKYRARKQEGKGEKRTLDVTVKFICADGHLMDVLIVESERAATDGENSEHLSLSVMTDVTELKNAEDRNHRQAITDHLTGLMNRQGLEAALAEKIREADASQQQLAFLFIDLDRFKWINDHLGHAAGDAVLCQVADKIAPLLQHNDSAARLGGDEFAIVLLSDRAEDMALDVAANLCAIFEAPFTVEGTETRLSASIGIALYPEHATSAASLLQKSDMAMYAKKHDGKNGALMFDNSMMDKARIRAEIEAYIEEGLAQNWFDAYFQPIIDLNRQRITGFEALMRMVHPQKGILPPGEIINVAEETGSISRLGNVILERAISHLAMVSRTPGLEDCYLAVNFSPLQFEPALPARITALLARHDIKPSRIVIEITEAVLMHDNPEIRRILDEISQFGCRIALDDFGTGYSSLSYLNRFPVDLVKIDQSFVRSVTDPDPDVRQKSRMLVEGIMTISHKMGCTVIAEGVETHDQWMLLKQMGVDCGQGYFFARPQAVHRLLETIAEEPLQYVAMGAA